MSMDRPTRNAYLKDELRNILIALQVTSTNSIRETSDANAINDAYLKGYSDALRSMSIALGLLPMTSTGQEGVGPRRAGLTSDSFLIEEEIWRLDP